MKKIVVVTGSPGSGKSTHIEETYEGRPDYRVISDDYQRDALYDSTKFEHSQHYEDLKETLLNTDLVPVIADIRWTRKEDQDYLVESLKRIVPEIEVEWELMDTPPEICKEHIDQRENRTPKQKRDEKKRVDQDLLYLSVPTNAKLVPYKQK